MVKDTNITKSKSFMNLNFVSICDFYMKNNVAKLSLTPSATRRYNAQISRVQTYFDLTIDQISLQYFYETVRSLKVSNAEKKRFINFCKNALNATSIFYETPIPDFTVLAFMEFPKQS